MQFVDHISACKFGMTVLLLGVSPKLLFVATCCLWVSWIQGNLILSCLSSEELMTIWYIFCFLSPTKVLD